MTKYDFKPGIYIATEYIFNHNINNYNVMHFKNIHFWSDKMDIDVYIAAI